MALFSQLLRLHSGNVPLEDFFTEIVAYLFQDSPELLFAWLEYTGLLNSSEYTEAHISTQISFNPLEQHSTGSRPDILVERLNRDCHDVIFIESKIGSIEGYEQLSRHADILASEFPKARERILIYVTRDFDPKEKRRILGETSRDKVRFEQLRCYTLYQFLQGQNQLQNFLVDEIITFMRESGMAQDNQFTTVDILALSNMSKAIGLMNATLSGKVQTEFEKIVGPPKKSYADKWKGLEEFERYMIIIWFEGNWWCGLGYRLRVDNIADYPKVGIRLRISPNSVHRQEIIEAMQQICARFGWQGLKLGDSTAWSGVARERSLKEFLVHEDHVAAVETYFLELIVELAEIKKDFSHLPWTVSS